MATTDLEAALALVAYKRAEQRLEARKVEEGELQWNAAQERYNNAARQLIDALLNDNAVIHAALTLAEATLESIAALGDVNADEAPNMARRALEREAADGDN